MAVARVLVPELLARELGTVVVGVRASEEKGERLRAWGLRTVKAAGVGKLTGLRNWLGLSHRLSSLTRHVRGQGLSSSSATTATQVCECGQSTGTGTGTKRKKKKC